MNILVCVKQVPAISQLEIDPITHDLIRIGTPSKLNPVDYYAFGQALKLKRQVGGNIHVITMGPPFAEDVLKECIAMGAKKGYLISDRAFGGADTLATGYTLAKAIEHIGSFDLIFTGSESSDGDTGQVGPEIAEFLKLPQITYAKKINLSGNSLEVQRKGIDGDELISCPLPAVVTVCRDADEKAPMLFEDFKSIKADIEVIDGNTLSINPERIGKNGSATTVIKVYAPASVEKGMLVEEANPESSAEKIVEILREKNLL